MWGRTNKSRKNHDHKSGTTLISKATQIRGEIAFEGVMHIEGKIQGNIRAEQGLLTLTETGWVEGDICVPRIQINGTVIGNVYCSEHLELAEKAVVTGSVFYNMIEMARGAEVNGSLEHHGNRLSESNSLLDNTAVNHLPSDVSSPESDNASVC